MTTVVSSISTITTMVTDVAGNESSVGGGSGAVRVVMPQGVGDNTSSNFAPSALTVAAGTRVTWEDLDDSAPHNVFWTCEPAGATVPNSPVLMLNGTTFTVTLTVPGLYAYECQYHAGWMRGTVVVTSTGNGTTIAAATTTTTVSGPANATTTYYAYSLTTASSSSSETNSGSSDL